MMPFKRMKHFFNSCRRFRKPLRDVPELEDNISQQREQMKEMFDRSVSFCEPLELPITLGDYILTKKLGSGAFGTVHICKNRRTKKKYAGKFFSISYVTKSNHIALIYSEVDILKRISHKNTISFVDLVFSRKGVLLVMELVEGQDLNDMLQGDVGMVEPFARILFFQLVEAIQYLHSQRIVHRDIKIENVLVDTRGTLKLVDYGLADLVDEEVYNKDGLTVSGIYGTRYCYPPEIAQAREDTDDSAKFIGDKVDIWTAGVFLYFLVSGKRPFSDESEEELMNDISGMNVDYDSVNFSPELEHLLRSILKKEPNERASIEQIISHPWSQNRRFDANCIMYITPAEKFQVHFPNGTFKKTMSCPASMRQIDKTGSSKRNIVSCRELSFFRSVSAIESTSSDQTIQEESSIDLDAWLLSSQSYNSMPSREEKPRRWRGRRILRNRFSELKSILRNLYDRFRGRVVRCNLSREDIEQLW